ncbi:LamG-like jellyroll fold domain-containing protein [Thiococcus pfennigii]|jgi:hypothetical protein|uniref:LamG-like jellyroll fold domain-containing protein n=1 Tax=Thiococcus pfennigii TaxID=1057 RepID=UPI0019056BA2|nr:LamG domain-containing protein [Thiococcus pfennigii]MBK1699569.1 hypothetical protein [Thiococcus pfennigii]
MKIPYIPGSNRGLSEGRRHLPIACVIFLTLTQAVAAQAATVSLAWDRVNDDRVALYQLRFGTNADYENTGGLVETAQTQPTNNTPTARTPDLSAGTYTFAVRACNSEKTLCSAFSDPVSKTIDPAPSDTTAPTVTAFSIPATANTLTVPITTFTATDSVGVTGYLVNESSSKPSATAAGWKAAKPTSYTFASPGSKTLYAWAKDAAGNVSASRSAQVSITLERVGLVAAYGFEETGGNATDVSGLGHDGLISGATRVAGKHGQALSFNGSSNWMTIANSGALDLSAAMTLEAWVYPKNLGDRQPILAKQGTTQSGPKRGFMFAAGDSGRSGKLEAEVFKDDKTKTSLLSDSSLSTNTWQHVALVYKSAGDGASTMTLYINGVARGSLTNAIAPVQSNNQPLELGRYYWSSSYNRYFNGLIDEVRIYNRALTAAEIQADMTAPVGAQAQSNTTTATAQLTSETTSAGAIVNGSAATAAALGTAEDMIDSPAQVFNSLPMEVGEIALDHAWQWIDFQREYMDPIVIAGPPSDYDGDPAVVRIRDIDTRGFWARIQEWDDLDGIHEGEVVGYMVMERGRHQLPHGAWVEAGRLETDKTNAFTSAVFGKRFGTAPVVLTTVTSDNEGDAVAARVQRINRRGFHAGLIEQEQNIQEHLAEHVDYIAWEASHGVLDGLSYEVGRTGHEVTDGGLTLLYQYPFATPPILLANTQSVNENDSAGLRWQNKDFAAVDLWVQEEQSKDGETDHLGEDVGYVLFGIADR